MKQHINIIAGGQNLSLPDDFSIDIDFQNPVFNSVEMASYPVEVPIEGNRSFLKNIEDINSDARTTDVEHTHTQIIIDGTPFASGTMRFADEHRLEDSVSLSVDAADQSFEDLISDLQCSDIPVKDDILIGEKIGNLYVQAAIDSNVTIKYDKGKKKPEKKTGTVKPHIMANTFEPQALGFSYPAKCEVINASTQEASSVQTLSYRDGNKVVLPVVADSYINVSAPYGETFSKGTSGNTHTAYYCNARVCYTHYALDEEGATSDEVERFNDKYLYEKEYRGPYWVLDADRPQSGICFYVLYFLDCLFAYLNVDFDKSALLEIEDFKHLCFFTTKCSYDTRVLHRGSAYTMSELQNIDGVYYLRSSLRKDQNGNYEAVAGISKIVDVVDGVPQGYHYFFEQEDGTGKNLDKLFSKINTWLSSRGCGGQLSMPKPENKSVNDLTYRPYQIPIASLKIYGEPKHVKVGVDGVQSITIESNITSAIAGANIMGMYANSGNFPKQSVSDLISSLENAFGIKFDYNYEQKKVTAYLMRDLFRKHEPDMPMCGQLISMTKISEKITGVRHCYSAESDSKEQQQNVRDGIKDYDTDFDYVEYPDPDDKTRTQSQTQTIINKSYGEFFSELSNSDMNVYIDRNTGNAYRIKINREFTDTASMKPVLFEVGQWKGVEYGDCSPLNEDFVKEFSVGFTPITFNDVNYPMESASSAVFDTDDVSDVGEQYNGIEVSGINEDSNQPLLAAYMDEQMKHEFEEFNIDNLLSCSVADVLVRETMKLVESYDPSDTDDGNSPLQTYDWGMSVALMRGGGSDMTVQEYDYNYDGFGNSKYRTVVGQYALCSDTMDAWGNIFDYNGQEEGVGAGERFSLKINADKSLVAAWAQERGISLCRDDETDDDGNIINKIRSRGLFQTFIIDLAYFFLHRKKYEVKMLLEPAQVTDIKNHWMRWWRIGDKRCIIDKVQCSVKNDTGMAETIMEVYSL